MCLFCYVYYSRCRHAELVQVTYCERAKTPRQLQRGNHHRHVASADNSQAYRQSSSFSYNNPQQLTFTSSSSLSHLHNQHHQIMLTATSSHMPPALDLDPSVEQAPHLRHAHLVPHSVQGNVDAPVQLSRRHSYTIPERPAVDTSGYSNLNIDIPLDTPSSLSMELTHDGKVMELVARYESVAGREGSDALEVPQGDHGTRAPSPATIRLHESDSSSTRHSSDGFVILGVDAPNFNRCKDESNNPRKPIPIQWTSRRQGPNLQTAQRAKAREKQKVSQDNLPLERGTRYPLDSSKARSLETATYLTKDAVAAVESDITSPTLTDKPGTLHRATFKAMLKGSTVFPVTGKHRPKSAIIITMPSQGGSSQISTASARQKKAPSSVVSSTGGSIYRTPPENTPTLSFVTAEEPHDDDITDLELTDSGDDEQVTKHSDGSPAKVLHHYTRGKSDPHIKAPAAAQKQNQSKPTLPKLSLKIPSSTDRKPPFTLGSASTSGSASPSSPSQSSRIPRIATTKKEHGRSPTISSPLSATALRRTKSAKSLQTTQANVPQGVGKEIQQVPQDTCLPVTPAGARLKHVRTVNSSDTTPIISRDQESPSDKYAMIESYLEKTLPIAEPEHTPLSEESKGSALASQATKPLVAQHTETNKDPIPEASSRVTSLSTVKAMPLEDAVFKDPAVIYSRKKSGASGISSDTVPNLASIPSSHGPFLNKSNPHAPPTCKQVRSEHSLHSSLASELRATAPEFVPLHQPQQDTQLVANSAAPDIFSIPWFYSILPMPYFVQSPEKGKSRMQLSSGYRYRARRQGPSKSNKPDPPPDAPQGPRSLRLPHTYPQPPRPQPSQQQTPGFSTLPRPRPARFGNGLYDSVGRRQGVSMTETTPFPDPVPPLARKEYVGYMVRNSGFVNIDRAAEFGGGICNKCEPDH